MAESPGETGADHGLHPDGGAILPLDFIRLLFSSMSTADLCASACACRSWQSVSLEEWPVRARQRWLHGWARTQWQELLQQGRHLRVYSERHKVGGGWGHHAQCSAAVPPGTLVAHTAQCHRGEWWGGQRASSCTMQCCGASGAPTYRGLCCGLRADRCRGNPGAGRHGLAAQEGGCTGDTAVP